MTGRPPAYVGRFAPSPTGPLHFGSLVAAVGSYLDAKKHNGQWLLRIEDLDPPRESTTAPAEIMSQLRAYGLFWDGDVLFQSSRLNAYEENLGRLRNQGLVFPCICSRKSIVGVYPGACRSRSYESTEVPFAERLLTAGRKVEYEDLIFGTRYCDVEQDVGDFIVKRKDKLFAYQLAVIVDDAYQEVTHVIRGSDLMDSTPRQILLAEYLSLPVPAFGHIPVVTDVSGHKLSKQTHAAPVDRQNPLPVLRQVLNVLGQHFGSNVNTVEQLLDFAIQQWDINRIPRDSFRYV
ncbi:MAG: tRNA glutamyl-Q(34) synthetase GluQRS [Gammaproteobacteria bacterium]|nr:tRNA glutamyl-Q(34) synthetase GluQRS [Gammaproteobacteria bacterium]